VFDQAQLKRWGISERALPAGSRIVNRPFEVVRENKWWFLGGAAVIVLEGWIILQPGISRVLRRRALRALQASEHRYRSLHETSRNLSMIVSRDRGMVRTHLEQALLGTPTDFEFQLPGAATKPWGIFSRALATHPYIHTTAQVGERSCGE